MGTNHELIVFDNITALPGLLNQAGGALGEPDKCLIRLCGG